MVMEKRERYQNRAYRTLCISCIRKGEKSRHFGKDHSEARSGAWKGGLISYKCAFCNKEKRIPPSWIRKGAGKYCSISCKGKAQEGKRISEKTRKKMREARKARKGFPQHHTKAELKFEAICKKNNLPFKYTGNGSFWIENINPDFVECNSKKIAIGVFGDYWHSPLLRSKIPYSQTYKGRKKILRKYGWKLIIFWEKDMLRMDAEQFVVAELKRNKIL